MTAPATDLLAGSDTHVIVGYEWVVDACGCSPELLCSLEAMQRLCDRIVLELELQIVGQPQWRQFPDPGGVTGLYLLSESHLACHTWPERGVATFNLFCCRRRREWPWEHRLPEVLLAQTVIVRRIERGPANSSLPEESA